MYTKFYAQRFNATCPRGIRTNIYCIETVAVLHITTSVYSNACNVFLSPFFFIERPRQLHVPSVQWIPSGFLDFYVQEGARNEK